MRIGRREAVGIVVALAVFAGVVAAVTGGGAGTLTVERVDELPQGQGAVAFGNLDPDQRETFAEAVSTGEPVALPNESARNEFVDPGYVRYDGDIYRTTVSD
ncbi:MULTISPECIES: hypothetical protein [Haloferax]|uniref:DUF7979 domain-containing protein n=3 Tax=Haloferax volcanii TaxID=2246 RepID=A0A558G8R7_HALVO|nr:MULTISPECIES: hypothetical protein [Haloferax]ELK52683.1 hypothetical protein D320_13474 [Haloferax sp. BAB-2207]ELZ72475.1 hypothetical protein C456_12888 [Haloferax lucentense DSM 14919]ELZ92324.1 hypothetical protein C452_06888 [Haloferax alexandrinus JCM 10717]MBC9985595.1 hypothetical protein [Haloferax sp. AS1]NLV01747.1 hypothetical protein [Haloferax alexandrinus]